MAGIGQLELVLTANVAKLVDALNQTTGRLGRLQTESAKTAAAVEKAGKAISGTFGMIKSAAFAAGAAFAGVFATGKLVGSFNSAATALDKIHDASQRLGVSTEFLSTLKHLGDLNGVSFEELGQIIDKVRNNIGQLVATGEGRAAKFLDILGVQLQDAAGHMRSIEDLIPEVAAAISRLPSSEQGVFFQKIFGDTRAQQLGILNFRAAREEAEKLGVLFSTKQTGAADAYGDAIKRVEAAWLGLRAKAVETLGPFLADSLNKLASFVAAIPELIQALGKAIMDVRITGDSGAMADMWQKLGELFRVGVRDLGVVIIETGLAVNKLVVSKIAQDAYLLVESEFNVFMIRFARMAATQLRRFAEEANKYTGAILTPLVTAFSNAEKGLDSVADGLVTAQRAVEGGFSGQSLREAFDGADFKRVADAMRTLGINVGVAGTEFLESADAATGFLSIIRAHGIDVEALNEAFDRFRNKLPEVQTAWGRFRASLGRQIEGFAQSAGDAFAQFAIDGKTSLEDLAKSWGRTLVSMATQLMFFKPLFEALGSAIGGYQSSASTAGDTFGPPPQPNARGNVFNGGQVQAFGGGGVINRPMMFPLRRGMGLAGEAGPEAIMPLARRGGKLGVLANGGGGVVVQIIDQRSGGERPEVSETTGPDGRKRLTILIRDTVKGLMGDGSLDRTMGQIFGARRQAATR